MSSSCQNRRPGTFCHVIRNANWSQPLPGVDPINEIAALIHNTVDDPGLLAIYDAAMEGLRKAFLLAYTIPGFETGDVFVWVFQVSDGYLDLLRQHTPESLAILAYFCVLLKRLDHYVRSYNIWLAFV